MDERFPIEWQGKTYHLSKLTIEVKKGFCNWLYRKLRADAEADFAGYPAKLNSYIDGLRARIWWVAGRMSPGVWEWLYKSPEGGQQYTRLLFGLTEKEMSDAELERLIDAKEADPNSDYIRALDEIHETANPKATAPPTSGSEVTATPSTGA